MKQLKVKEVSSILKKYVAKRDTRPVLQTANVTENHIIATDSHQLIKIDRCIVESEFSTGETKLFDPKTNTYSNLEANYPDTSRLIPNHANVETIITLNDIKRLTEVIDYLQHVSGSKKHVTVNVASYENELVFGTFDVEKGEYSGFYNTGVKVNEEISFSINGNFFESMLTSFKKVLKNLSQKEFTMKFTGSMRPVLFETVNKELQILILPIRMYDGFSLKNVAIAENQDVTIEKKVTIKSVVKKVVLFVSGIVRKKAVEHEQINDFMTYLLKEDVTSVENETDQETKERRYNNLMLFAEIDGHLFHVGYVRNKENLKLYTKDELMKTLKESHKEGLEAGKKVSVGMTQYLETIEEVETENHYNSEATELQAKNGGYLQHFSSNTVEIEEEEENMSTIQLQGVGVVDAIPASEVREGDVRLYNFFGTGTVIKIIEKTPKTLTFITVEDGKYYMFDIRKTSLVAIVKHDQDISNHNPKEAYKLSGNNKGMIDVSEYFQVEQTEETVSNENVTMIEFTNVEDVWQTLKEGKQVLMNNSELDSLQDYIETLDEKEQDIYYHEFSSLFEKKFACGLLTRCYVCELYSERNKETEEEKMEAYHIELQEKGMALTESKPQINKEATYKVIVSKDRENNLIGEFEKVLTGEEVEFQLFMNEVLEIIEEIQPVAKTIDKPKLIYDFDYNRNVNIEHGNIEASPGVENAITEQTDTSDNISYVHNKDRNSIEISFPDKPSEEVRSIMKANRFRWARTNGVWYKKNPTEKDFTFVESLGASQNGYNRNESKTLVNFPEIEITPIESYTIPQELQDRENDNNWITRSVKRNHNKEVQDLFVSYQNEVLSILESTDNSKVTYELKRSLEYFKKHYYETYMKYITAKANTPSWITTGRGGMNVSSYNKKMERIDNHMNKLSELSGEMKNRINKAKKQIAKDEKQRITAAIENSGVNIEFKMKTKEFTYLNITEKRKVHTYQDYWIVKTWGAFRIFKGNIEIHSCKTTEKLEHAKKFVAYHIQQEQTKKAI